MNLLHLRKRRHKRGKRRDLNTNTHVGTLPNTRSVHPFLASYITSVQFECVGRVGPNKHHKWSSGQICVNYLANFCFAFCLNSPLEIYVT